MSDISNAPVSSVFPAPTALKLPVKDVNGTLYDLRIEHKFVQKAVYGNTFAVYETLLLLANKYGEVVTIDKRIAEMCRCSERTVRDCRLHLINVGLLEVIYKGRVDKDGKGVPSKYRVKCKRKYPDGSHKWDTLGSASEPVVYTDAHTCVKAETSKEWKLDKRATIRSLLLGQEYTESWKSALKLTLAEVALCIICIEYANKQTGEFFLSLKRVAELTGMSRRTLIRARNGLEFMDMIEPLDTHAGHDEDGNPIEMPAVRGKSRRYRLLCAEWFGGVSAFKTTTMNSQRVNNIRFLRERPELKQIFDGKSLDEKREILDTEDMYIYRDCVK